MYELIVLPPGVTHTGLVVALTIRHSETLEAGQLVAISTIERHIPPDNAESELRPGLVRHYRTGLPYQLRGFAYWSSTKQEGVWYSPLYFEPDDPKWAPDYFRPLRTQDGSAGWLDLVNDHPRFLRFDPKAPR